MTPPAFTADDYARAIATIDRERAWDGVTDAIDRLRLYADETKEPEELFWAACRVVELARLLWVVTNPVIAACTGRAGGRA